MSDLISREQALKAVHEAIVDGKSWYSALSHLPSAEKTGKWVFTGEYFINDFMNKVWECNQCGWEVVDNTNYCQVGRLTRFKSCKVQILARSFLKREVA